MNSIKLAKLGKTIGLGVVGLLIALTAIAYLLPRYASVTRSTTISAPAEVIFNLVNNFEEFNRWSPWAEKDPNTQYTFTDVKEGVGAKMTWSSADKNVGSGSQEIIESIPFQRVRVKLMFGTNGEMGQATAFFDFAPTGEQTVVTWGFDMDVGGNPVKRYFSLLMNHWVGNDYEKGLQNLKILAEENAKSTSTLTATRSVEINEIDIAPQTVLYLSGRASHDPADIDEKYRSAYSTLRAIMERDGIEQAGPPMGITTEWDAVNKTYSFDAAIPIKPETMVKVPTDARVAQTYSGPAVVAKHVGPYDTLADTYGAVYAYMTAHGLEPFDRSWEEYINDAGSTDPQELVTMVYFPVVEKLPETSSDQWPAEPIGESLEDAAAQSTD